MSTTAPVVQGSFASANGDFYAESSGHNRHRRATAAELKAHFKSAGSEKDKPGHWYEAQLIHYGLPPSKTKAVAFKRLFDAVNGGGSMSVPAHIAKTEADLKKEWTKRDREAKKEAKGEMLGVKKTTEKMTAAAKTAAGTKRKADEHVDLTINVGGINVTLSASNSAAQGVAKKAKTTTAKSTAAKTTAAKTTTAKTTTAKTTTAKTTTPKAKAAKTTAVKTTTKVVKDSPKPKPTPKAKTPAPPKAKTPVAPKVEKTSAKSIKAEPASTSAASSSQPARAPRTKQTARRSSGFIGPASVSRAAAMTPDDDRSNWPRQTARRGGSFAARGRGGGSARSPPRSNVKLEDDDQDDYGPPPPYSAYGESYSEDEDDGSSASSDQPLAKLGLLNGRYEIKSSDVSGQWPHLGDDFGLVLTLAGNELWGSFDLGVYEGVFRINERPWESSHEEVEFNWRGREQEGPIVYGDNNFGWIKFLGGGRIEGWLDRMNLEFRGRRAEGQGTKSEIDARSMKSEWNSYSEQEYERENRGRWGGSSW